ncbi:MULTISPECIES: cytochrome c biogenesis protein CcdC [unclassified Lysinibacillus]|uniref:CcdC family protein n=1 Tax=unclassified Lysinibacillus TaxID=2636778 RepID=UPI002010FF34|nr:MULTISPECIES: cytochrome c biogenesis protein CcdC [unclassified Lysinibacillus]MCL1694402.1 cytochrome c biogenesis protein CcdC [Lysinibacillus sp. BPa_S21]MCL1699235.1 cytochrome c biogenesis protein CcdC [Lysinibacillus sp. Bpr_S20]
MFSNIPSQYYVIGSTIMAIFMGTFVMVLRMRASKKPTNEKKIIIPPIAMSTGALMFLFEQFRVPPMQILEAAAVGVVFSTILIATSKFEVKGQDIYLKRSKAFVFILVGLLVFRVIAKMILSSSIDVGELAGMFWILAFAMLLPWRIAMLIQFIKIKKTIPLKNM